MEDVSLLKQNPRIAGMDKEINNLYQVINNSFNNTEIHREVGIPEIRTSLISGPCGVGKKTLVQHVCKKIPAKLFIISLSSIIIKYDLLENVELGTKTREEDSDNDDNDPIRSIFIRAKLSAPSVILLKDLDILAKGHDGEWKPKIINMLEGEFQEIYEKVFIIGLTCDAVKLPDSMRKLDFFQHNLNLDLPTRIQREEILELCLSNLRIINSEEIDDLVKRLGMVTSGYVAKDLEKLVRLAVLHSLRELMAIDKKPMRQDHDDNELENLFGKMSLSDMDYESVMKRSWKLKWDNFQYALSIMKPSQKVEFESVLPSRRWCDVGGYEDLKRKIEKMVKLPLTHSDTYARLGLKPTSGLLLYGPSGCGKTILVQALVYESRMNVICVKGPSICSKYFGETENIIRNLFKTARKISPCIIFFDEIDSIASRRDWNDEEGNVGVGERVLSTLLNEMDGIQELNDVLVIGCTNRPDRIDDALVRPGRIDQSLYVGLPNKDERTDILKVISLRVPFGQDVDLDNLAEESEGFSGADLDVLIRESSFNSLRENITSTQVLMRHIQPVLKKMRKANIRQPQNNINNTELVFNSGI